MPGKATLPNPMEQAMQPCTRNVLPDPGPKGAFAEHLTGGRIRYGGRCLQRRNENGLLAVVERHRDEIRRKATLPRPADPGRQ